MAAQRAYEHLLSKDRIDKLIQIGFIWSSLDYKWKTSYQNLLAFKKRFGHCEVPKGRKEFAQLAEWVGKQRIDKRKKLKRLSAEKIKKLNKIGFHWGRGENKPWDKRLQELKEYKAKFGHCRVPRSWQNQALANWVAHQRSGRSKLSREKKNKLNQLGFQWIILKKEYKKG